MNFFMVDFVNLRMVWPIIPAEHFPSLISYPKSTIMMLLSRTFNSTQLTSDLHEAPNQALPLTEFTNEADLWSIQSGAQALVDSQVIKRTRKGALMFPGQFETDTFPTALGELGITFLGHGSLMLTLGKKVIHVDPFSRVAGYAGLPQADLILITHEHHDHLDVEALQAIRNDKTEMLLTELCAPQVSGGKIMRNGDSLKIGEVMVEAVPAYNLVHLRENGQPFHPRGQGNGYVLNFGDLRVYIAGDTEDIPEMATLKDISIAFLPVNLPYTMTPEMASRAAQSFMPKILYPYHYGSTDLHALMNLCAGSGIEVRIRKMA